MPGCNCKCKGCKLRRMEWPIPTTQAGRMQQEVSTQNLTPVMTDDAELYAQDVTTQEQLEEIMSQNQFTVERHMAQDQEYKQRTNTIFYALVGIALAIGLVYFSGIRVSYGGNNARGEEKQ